ncbi:AAA family ATPase [Actinoplanes sp. NPDC049118]|uniref:helix-turn-helix transcriptional regulator n=1 Tax=Actinoplanes sp. NPDC049118 TaxID=3155769 RepID=UPI0033E85BB2
MPTAGSDGDAFASSSAPGEPPRPNIDQTACVTGLPFDLVETKLGVPPIRPGTVAKTDVIARLCESRRPFATVIGPAGYGKTTLLAAWERTDPRPFAWIALDGRDDDGIPFLRYIVAAMHRIEPVPPEAFDALSGPGAAVWSTGLPHVGAALAARRHPLVLVLDDLHAMRNSTCLDVLAALCDYVPPGSQIAVASREDPALPLARWRMQERLTEVGVPDLRFDEQEARTLLNAAGVDLDDTAVADLTGKTEGWPAGLYMAALSVKTGVVGPAPAEAFTGDDRLVADYFRYELLSRLPEAEARFLMHTSVLDRMSGGICDAVLRATGSASTLAALERSNSFLVPLDRRSEWYRYHHLFRQLLRNELDHHTDPATVAELNRRAMTWCMANDLPEAAVSYGQAAGETATVAGLVGEQALALYYDGRMATAEEWLSWFSRAELAQFPALAVFGAWFRVLTGRPAEAQQWLAIADGATTAIPLFDGSPTIKPWVANLRAFMMPHGVRQALADADLAIEQFPPASDWLPSALLARGAAHALLDEAEDAHADLTAAIDLGAVSGASEDALVAEAELALLAIRQAAWTEAAVHARRSQILIEQTGLGHYGTSALTPVLIARIALHEGDVAKARLLAARAHRLRPLLDHGLPWFTVQVGLELTRVHLAMGEEAAARTIFTETERVLELRPDLGTLSKEMGELRERLRAAGTGGVRAMTLTGAELRLLPYLATHLTFAEIGRRLYVSGNTVKAEAVSIYRKLDASTRSAAIERAVDVGLLESTIYPPRPERTPAR